MLSRSASAVSRDASHVLGRELGCAPQAIEQTPKQYTKVAEHILVNRLSASAGFASEANIHGHSSCNCLVVLSMCYAKLFSIELSNQHAQS